MRPTTHSIEAGINVCDPIEVAAGNDIVAFRRTFGRDMAYRGGVDKRAMAKGGAALRAEIDRLRPVVEDGGYVPGCDHGVPPDVSWPNYVETVRLLAQICEGETDRLFRICDRARNKL